MNVFNNIDYMQYSSDFKPSTQEGKYRIKSSFVKNYKAMYEYDSGVTYHTGHNKTTKGLTIYRGEQCQNIADSRAFISNMIQQGATFSRLDLAVTVENGISVSSFQTFVREGLVSGSLFDAGAKTIMNDKTTNAETTYLGDIKKRAKRGLFRCYDKAIEQGEENRNLTRFELEEHQKKAHVTARRYADGMTIGDIIQHRVIVDNPLWREIMGEKSEKLKRFHDEKEIPDYDPQWKWLIETVAKTLGVKIAEEVYEQSHLDNFGTFQDAVQRAYNGRMNELLGMEWFNESD